MDVQTCLKKLQYVGVLQFATVDKTGAPQVRCVSAIHFDEDSLFFFTARGKDFANELKADGRVQILGYTRFKEMIRLSGRAVEVPADEQEECRNLIFEEQPYLANVYPEKTREIGIIFKISEAQIEYFNLGTYPIERFYYAIGNAAITPKGFEIAADKCIGCGSCLRNCPQQAIVKGEPKPYRIMAEHCLHCGSCFEHCPVHAVKRLG